MVARTNLITVDAYVCSPAGVVFSTNPQRAEGEDEVSYFIKGPDLEMVFAEIAGCTLARQLGLPVPAVAACVFGSDTFAGSARVENAIRDIEPWLARPAKVSNFESLFSTAVVDVWLANKDRNIGNVLGTPLSSGKGSIEFIFIDFEKSVALRPQPTVTSTMMEPKKLWPSGLLGQYLSQKKPMYPPTAMVEKIKALTTERCASLINEAADAIRITVPWKDDSIHALSKRAEKIQELAEEVWTAV